MENRWKELSTYLKGIGQLQARQKRAIVPIVGKALSVLFGTVSEGNVKTHMIKIGRCGECRTSLSKSNSTVLRQLGSLN